MKKIISLLVVLAMLMAMVPAVLADDAVTYTKISSMDELTTGSYVMTVSDSIAANVVDGTWITSAAPTIDGDTVTDAAGAVWTVTVNDDGTVSLKDSNGVYIAPKGGNSNGLTTGTEYAWAVSCTDGLFTFAGQGSDTVVLAFNTDSQYLKFRGYKTTTVSNYPDSYPSEFTLYKLDEAGSSSAAAALVDGDNAITTGSYTYTATQTGTLYLTFTQFSYTSQWGESDATDWIEDYIGSDPETHWLEMTVNGTPLENGYYGAVEVTEGDKVEIEWAYLTDNVYVVSWTMNGTLNLNYEKYALPELGSEQKPVELAYADCPTKTIEIAAGATAYYNLFYDLNEAVFTVTGEGAYILMPAYNDWGWPLYDDEGNVVWNKIEAVDGVVSVEITGYGVTIQIGNDGTAAATFDISAEYIEGTYNNPAQIVNGANVVDCESGVYYYGYTADCDTTLTLSISSSTGSWAYNYYDSEYIDSGYHTSDEEEVVSTITLTIPMGETYTVVVWAANWELATITLEATIDCPHDYVDNVCSICGALAEIYYENVAEIEDDFSLTLGEDEVVEYVDITEEHTVVLGEDGYYHLDSADGAIVYVDMDYIFNFADPINSTTGSGQVYLYVYDEDGALVKAENGEYLKYNATAAIQEYLDAADENGYYPLTEDLIYFYQSYGKSQGWYLAGMSWLVTAELIPEDFDPDTAWMFACLTVVEEEVEETPVETPEDTTKEDDTNPKTADTVSVMVAAAVISAMSIVALPAAKKFF